MKCLKAYMKRDKANVKCDESNMIISFAYVKCLISYMKR
jgi:hypothetical protein